MALSRLNVAVAVETISNVKDQRVLVNQAIEIALDRVYQWYDWPYYLDSKHGIINTVVDYNTGLATATKGSPTIAGNASTVWTSSMVGRKIRIGSNKAYYRIIAVGAINSLTIDNNYQDTTATLSSYEIYKDEYKLQADVDKYKGMRQIENGVPMLSLSPRRLDEMVPTPQNFADPIYEAMVGTSLDTYTTGTVSASGSTITGAGTSWLSVEGLGRMSRIRIGTNVYTVKSVDSDTQITAYDAVGTIVAGSTYEIKLNNLTAQVYFLPNASRLLYYRYFRQPEPLVNDYDTPDMPYEFHWLLIYGALSFIYLQKGDINKAQIEAENRFVQGLEMMKMKLGSFTPDKVTRRKSIDSLRRSRRDNVENSSFDWRYAA